MHEIRRALLPFCTAVALAFPATAVAQDNAVVLPGASPWHLDMAEDSCALRRQFSDGLHTVNMEMRQFAPERGLRFMIYSGDLDVASGRLRYRVLPDVADREDPNAFTVSFDEGEEGVLFNGSLGTSAVAAAAEADENFVYTFEQRTAREREITGLHLPRVFTEAVTLETGSLAEPMRVMRACMDNLLTFWGIDVEAHRTLSREVQPVRMERWADRFADVYPLAALRDGHQAALQVRAIVNTEGRVEDCFIQSGVGHDVFNETACERLTRFARFEPALDIDGNPIRSFWTTSIYYTVN